MPSWKKMITSGSDARLNSLVIHSGSLNVQSGDITVGMSGTVSAYNFQGLGVGSSFVGVGHIGSGAQLSGSFSGSFQGDGSSLTGVIAAPSVSASYAATASYHKDFKSIGLTIDGGGSAITAGIKGDIIMVHSGYIRNWTLLADTAGSIVIDIWKDTYANYPPTVGGTITGTEKPTLSGVNKNRDNSLTTWTTGVSSGDILRFNVDSAATVTRVNLIMTLETA